MNRLKNNTLIEDGEGVANSTSTISTPTNSTTGIANIDKPMGVIVRRRKLEKLADALKRYKEKKDKQNGIG